MRTTRDLANYIHDTQYDDIGGDVIERAKSLSLSSLGSAVTGADMDTTRLMARYADNVGAKGNTTVIGYDFMATPEWGAAMNCIASHCTELEDVAWPDATYTCFLIPSVFAMGESVGASGKDVLEALILGYEVVSRSGTVTSDGGAVKRGVLTGSSMGTVGVAGAAAKLLRLDREKTLHAMAVAASFGSGLTRQTGSGAHVIEAGMAGLNGISAAHLAADGLTGNPTILEGKAGFWDATAGCPDIDFPLGQGDDFRIMAVGMKKYPCCYLSQRIIDGVLDIVKTNGLTADDIVEVEVGVNAVFPQILKYPDPQNAEEARFSLPHIVASAISGEDMFVDTFTAEKLRDEAILAQRKKAKMAIHEEWGRDQLGKMNTVSITTKNGERFDRECYTAKGDPSDPLSAEEISARYDRCTENRMDDRHRMETRDMLLSLETVTDVRDLMQLYRGQLSPSAQ
ncbi:MmgE/PrpD family protein [Parvularcula marina]|nr:MmgE/PrpD family protein [Parvularcula marina]